MVGISGIEQGTFVADRYRVVERLTRFAIADSGVTGAEYEYWLALDETRGAEVWLQVAGSRGVVASGGQLAAVVSALRRLNHPALPVVLDFGEVEVDVFEDGVQEAVLTSFGYAVLEPVEGESLATALLRESLTEAERFAILVEIADVLKVLTEVDLVHGRLSAYSFLLTERGVVLIDAAASMALHVASGGELTAAADVYAFAWLACLILVGFETVEAEFGAGFEVGAGPEGALAPELLTLELIERRRVWAQASLAETYGVDLVLAGLIVAALGEASARPAVGAFVAALPAIRRGGGTAVSGGFAAAGAGPAGGWSGAGAAGGGLAGAGAVAAVAGAAVAGESLIAAASSASSPAPRVSGFGPAGSGPSGPGSSGLISSGFEASAGGGSAAGRAGSRRRAGGAAGASAAVAGSVAGGAVGYAAGSVGHAGAAGSQGAAATAREQSPRRTHRRSKALLYVGVVVGILLLGGIAWGVAGSGSPKSVTAAAAVSPSPAGPAAASVPASPSAAVSAPAQTVAAAATSASALGGATGATPGPVFTAPATPAEALGRIQKAVSGAESAGQLAGSALTGVNQALGTVQREINAGGSVQAGIYQLRQAAGAAGVPAALTTQIKELIPYLVANQGS